MTVRRDHGQRATALASREIEWPQPDTDLVHCRVAESARDRRAHWRVRHAVFVEEQLLFSDSDQDVRDFDELTVLCVGLRGDVVAGAVRVYPLDAAGEHWQGDRLAVLPDFRIGLGAPLVRFAVATARERGGRQMSAHVQLPNVAFFDRLGWRRDGPTEIYFGVPHQPMVITWSDDAVTR